MTIIVDIKPEVQAELARQAAAQGRAIEAHAASLLEKAVHIPALHSAPAVNDLMALLAPVRGLFADGELDFRRNGSIGRLLDLS
jgi:hypothetical protein